jgi:hypothetical protein
VRDIDFKVISATKNSNKFQKTRFWREKSVENVITLEGLPFNSSMISFYIWLFKRSIHTLLYAISNVENLLYLAVQKIDTYIACIYYPSSYRCPCHNFHLVS